MQHPGFGVDQLSDPGYVLEGVDALRDIRGGDDAHPHSVLEGPQLLELLGPLEAPLGQGGELEEGLAGVAVDADVHEGERVLGPPVAEAGDRGPREVEGVAAAVD